MSSDYSNQCRKLAQRLEQWSSRKWDVTFKNGFTATDGKKTLCCAPDFASALQAWYAELCIGILTSD